jgi:hypothetical protein
MRELQQRKRHDSRSQAIKNFNKCNRRDLSALENVQHASVTQARINACTFLTFRMNALVLDEH